MAEPCIGVDPSRSVALLKGPWGYRSQSLVDGLARFVGPNPQWADVWRGAFITAVLFAVGKYCISLYLTHVAPASTYGAAGSLVLILLWFYYSSLILSFGTCLTIATLLQRGHEVLPKRTAVRTRLVLEDADATVERDRVLPERH